MTIERQPISPTALLCYGRNTGKSTVFDLKLIEMIRKPLPAMVAEDLIDVQPMDPPTIKNIVDAIMPELIASEITGIKPDHVALRNLIKKTTK